MKKKLDGNNQIKIGAIMGYFAIAFNIVAGLLYTPWMVREIGQSDYGLYTLAISVISLFTMEFGLGLAVQRFLSKYKANNDVEGAKKFLGTTFKLFFVIATIMFVILTIVFFFIENIYEGLNDTEINKLKVVYLIAGLFAVISFPFKPLDGILLANERFVFGKFLDLLQKVINIVLIILALLLGYKLYAIVIANVVAGLVIIISKIIYIKNATDTSIDFLNKDKAIMRGILAFSGWSTIITLAQRFIINITPTILGAFSGSIQIAIFAIGMTIEGYIWTISRVLGGLFLPKVSKITADGKDRNQIEILMIKVGRIQLLIVGLIIIGFATMGLEFMLLWMGDGFIDSYYVALLLIATYIVSVTQEIAYTYLIALNKIKYRAFATLIIAGISMIFSYILSPMFGAIGSGIAIFIGNVVGVILIMNIVYYKVLKLNILKFFKECHVKMAIPLILTFLIGISMQYFSPVSNLLFFVGKAIILALIYFILMWKLSLNPFEKNLIIGFLRRLKIKGV